MWRAACGAIRAWAKRHPHEYALLYGSPVPGYAAPQDTIDPATAVYARAGRGGPPVRRAGRAARPTAAARRGSRPTPPGSPPSWTSTSIPARTVRLLGAWTQLFGLVSFELFGHTHGVIEDHDAFFEDRVEAMADDLGL